MNVSNLNALNITDNKDCIAPEIDDLMDKEERKSYDLP